MPSYNVYSGDKSTLAAKINTTQTTGVTIAAMNINGTLTGWANTAGVIEVSEQSDATLKREWIYYTGTSVDATTKVATLSGVVRGISSTTSDVTSGSTGQSFAKGATVRFVTFHDLLNKKANLDRANTWSAAQSFAANGNITPTSTTTPVYHGQRLTTTQRDALTGVLDGDWIYNTTANQTQWYEGGAWVTNAAGGTVADASTTVAGKVEEAVLSELSAGTAAGATGARLFVNPSLFKKTSSGAAEGNAVQLNSSSVVDPTLGGTGRASDTAYAVICGSTTGTGPQQSIASVGTSGQFLKSNGAAALPTFQDLGSIYYSKPLSFNQTKSATLTNPTVMTAFSTGQISIATGTIIPGTKYYFNAIVHNQPDYANNVTYYGVMLGSTTLCAIGNTEAGGHPINGKVVISGWFEGTEAAGASTTVRWFIETAGAEGGPAVNDKRYGTTASIATNGSLTFAIGGYIDSGTAETGTMYLVDSSLIKMSTTLFA